MAQANTNPPFLTLINYLDPSFVQSPQKGLERWPMALEWTRLLFHALDRGQRYARGRSEIGLVPAKQATGGTKVLTGEIF